MGRPCDRASIYNQAYDGHHSQEQNRPTCLGIPKQSRVSQCRFQKVRWQWILYIVCKFGELWSSDTGLYEIIDVHAAISNQVLWSDWVLGFVLLLLLGGDTGMPRGLHATLCHAFLVHVNIRLEKLYIYLRRRRRLFFGSVCLSVYPSDYSQTCERILTKLFGGVGHGSRTKLYNFGGDPDHASDPGVQSPKSGSSGSAEVCALWAYFLLVWCGW